MMSFITDRRHVWLFPILAFGLCTAAIWMAPVPRFVPGNVQTAALGPRVSPLVDQPVPDISQMIARPLFWESRRPVQVAAPPPIRINMAPSVAPTAGIVLMGVMHSGRDAAALVTIPTDTVPHELHVGSAIGGLVVDQILSDGVLFGEGGKQYVVKLPTPDLVAPTLSLGSTSTLPPNFLPPPIHP